MAAARASQAISSRSSVTATVYAHVRLRLQRDAIDLLGRALRTPAEITGKPDDGDEPPLVGGAVH